jgi:hypothetical protein
MDEAAPAVHAMCLAETGRDADGVVWPLYSSAAGGGHHPLTLMAFDILWMKVFGTSRAAFRAVSAFWILVTAFGLFFLARDISNLIPPESSSGTGRPARRIFPWMVLLAALLSPWGFQFSRVGWEAPLAPAYMILALAGVMRCHRSGQWGVAWSVFAGFCAAASMTSYPPLRAVVPLVLATSAGLLLAVTKDWGRKWRFAKRMFAASLVAAVCFAPTVRMMADKKINERMNNVAIWNERWMHENIGVMGRWPFLIKSFLDNLALHLRPSFLFIDGDASWRHNPHLTGQLSPIDMLALLIVLWAACSAMFHFVRGQSLVSEDPRATPASAPASRWLVAISLVALLFCMFGLIPAALTYEAVPHALRAIGAWPFIALFTGAVLALGWTHRRHVPPILALVALAYTIYFLPAYFHVYDKAVNHWFMREMTDVIAKETQADPPKTVAQIVSEHLAYSYRYDEVPRYYLMTGGNMRCEEAKSALRSYRESKK